jgi:hypothetical protein
MREAVDLWPRAKELLLPYEGEVSQLYVLDLPLSFFPAVLERLSDQAASPQLITLNGHTGAPAPLTPETQASLLTSSEGSTNHVLEGQWISGPPLRIWIWTDAEASTFDLEFVFWVNLMFPIPDDDERCVAAFAELIAFAEGFRVLSPGSDCVLSASETGDPRDDRAKPWTLFW